MNSQTRRAAALLGYALFACTPPPPTQSPPIIETRSYDVASASPLPDGAAPPPDGGSAPSSAQACRLTVTESIGCQNSQIEALIAPARSRIEACRGGTGGKLRIRVREAGGKVAFDLEPGASLAPAQKECVLEALSTIHEGVASTVWSGATVPPTGFTSLITIEW